MTHPTKPAHLQQTSSSAAQVKAHIEKMLQRLKERERGNTAHP